MSLVAKTLHAAISACCPRTSLLEPLTDGLGDSGKLISLFWARQCAFKYTHRKEAKIMLDTISGSAMEQKRLVVFLVVAVLPVTLTASANRLGSVYLESRSKRASSTGGENSDFKGKYVSLQGDGIHFHSKSGYLSVTTLN